MNLCPTPPNITDVGPNATAFANGERRCVCAKPASYISYTMVEGAHDREYYSVKSLRCMACIGVVYCPAKDCFVYMGSRADYESAMELAGGTA